jgi:CrcB protein
MPILWIATFGLLGVFSRYGIDQWTSHLEMPIPLNTLGINILGSFLAGVIYVLGMERSNLTPDLKTGILVGFLGGFTTFSAYCLQSALLLEKRALQTALIYFVMSPVTGLLATLGGLQLTRLLLRQ